MLPLSPEAFQKMTNEELFQYCKSELDEVSKREGLSRQARRKQQRDFADMEKAIKSLSPHQMQLVKALSQMQAYQMTQDFSEKATNVMEDTFKATLVVLGANNVQIETFMDNMYELLHDEAAISVEFKKRYGGNEKMATKKIEEIMVQAEKMAMELIKKGVKQNEMIEILISKIHLLSKAKAAKAISNVKAQMKAENKDIENLEKEAAVEDITNVILNSNKQNTDKPINEIKETVDIKEEIKKEVKEETEVQNTVIENKATKKSSLKIKSVIVEGENGTYKKEGDVVILERKDGTLQFNSKQEVMDFAAEICEVYAM